jgi:hypothetical protein
MNQDSSVSDSSCSSIMNQDSKRGTPRRRARVLADRLVSASRVLNRTTQSQAPMPLWFGGCVGFRTTPTRLDCPRKKTSLSDLCDRITRVDRIIALLDACAEDKGAVPFDWHNQESCELESQRNKLRNSILSEVCERSAPELDWSLRGVANRALPDVAAEVSDRAKAWLDAAPVPHQPRRPLSKASREREDLDATEYAGISGYKGHGRRRVGLILEPLIIASDVPSCYADADGNLSHPADSSAHGSFAVGRLASKLRTNSSLARDQPQHGCDKIMMHPGQDSFELPVFAKAVSVAALLLKATDPLSSCRSRVCHGGILVNADVTPSPRLSSPLFELARNRNGAASMGGCAPKTSTEASSSISARNTLHAASSGSFSDSSV